jgi:FKBP-type peptidyl-prolyl cis-trans isomerase FkpA
VKQWLVCVVIAFVAVACNDDGGNPNDPSQVNIEFSATDLVVGTGAQAANGNSVTVHYTLWLYNNGGPESKGTKIDASRDRGSPFSFTLGARQTVPGFEQGILGMRVGGSRRIYVPSQLGYGAQGAPQGGIPPNAALVFEVELVSVN